MEDRQPLYLEPDEEIPSVIDRLEEYKGKTVALVVPKTSVVLQSIINIKLLQRVTNKLNIDFCIVSQDPIGRNLSAQIGIAVYDSLNSKTPVLEPIQNPIEKEGVIEVDLSKPKKPPVQVHHFQEEKESVEGEDKTDFTTEPISEEPEPIPNEEKIFIPPVKDAPKIQSLKPKKRKGLIIIASVSIVIIALGLLLFYPKATATIVVTGEVFAQSVDILASKEEKNPDISGAKIPAQEVEITKEADQKFSATGKKNVGEKAKGTITFYNSWSTDAQNLTSGARLSKDGKNFILTTDLIIPGATLTLKEGQVVTNPGKINGNIEATDAGESHNVNAGKFTIADIPAEKREKIYAESTAQLSGGSTKEITIVSAADIELAKEVLKIEIANKAKDELNNQSKGSMLLDSAIYVETLEEVPSSKEGVEANDFNMKIKAKARALVFSESGFRDVFLGKVKEKVPNDKELLLTDGGTDEIIAKAKDVDMEKGQMTIIGSISTKIGPKIDLSGLKAKLAGKKTSQAVEIAKATKSIEDANIVIQPNWLFNYLPFSSKQITVKVEYK